MPGTALGCGGQPWGAELSLGCKGEPWGAGDSPGVQTRAWGARESLGCRGQPWGAGDSPGVQSRDWGAGESPEVQSRAWGARQHPGAQGSLFLLPGRAEMGAQWTPPLGGRWHPSSSWAPLGAGAVPSPAQFHRPRARRCWSSPEAGCAPSRAGRALPPTPGIPPGPRDGGVGPPVPSPAELPRWFSPPNAACLGLFQPLLLDTASSRARARGQVPAGHRRDAGVSLSPSVGTPQPGELGFDGGWGPDPRGALLEGDGGPCAHRGSGPCLCAAPSHLL